jgi:uncharacterized membrane protein YedE/YeeE
MDYATEFTPVTAMVGGGLIGLATLWLMLANGRIAGISGIAGAMIAPEGGDRIWRLAFIVGLVAAPLGYMATGHQIDVTIPASTPVLVIAGLLVGLGTQLGSGCTSGHGVCGISRFSARGIVATITFMVTGAIAVFVIRHLL